MRYTIIKFDSNSWIRTEDGERPVILDDCGHVHRSLDAAKRCREKLINYNSKLRSWSAYWNGAQICDAETKLPTADYDY